MSLFARTRRGQSALEFVLLASVMLVGISVLIIAAQRMLLDVQHDKDAQAITAVVGAIESELALADAQPVGYQHTFLMPYTIEGIQYSIAVLVEDPAYDGLVVTYRDTRFLWFVNTNITGTIVPGQNVLVRTATGVKLN